MLFQHIFIGLIAAAIGVLSLKYNYQLVGFTGRQDFIESKLGAGSTYFAYKILSVLLALGGIIYMLGLGHATVQLLISPFAGLFR